MAGGPSLRSMMPRVQLIISRNTSHVAGCWISQVVVNVNPMILYWLGGLASSWDTRNDWQWVVHPTGVIQSLQTLGEGYGAGFLNPPTAAPPPGLEWFLKSSGQWWWFIALAVSHHQPLTGTPWGGPIGFCYDCSLAELVLPVGPKPVLLVRVK